MEAPVINLAKTPGISLRQHDHIWKVDNEEAEAE